WGARVLGTRGHSRACVGSSPVTRAGGRPGRRGGCGCGR
ncbi:MAG: hypothetical protein AVDCRST_MAG64-3735, partial [uncultured Phycisphaerae bacterium]